MQKTLTINDLIKKLQQIRKAVPGDTEVRIHENDRTIECGDFTLKLDNLKVKHIPYICYRCKHDSRCLSKDSKHKLCSRVCAEVTIEECEEMLEEFNKENQNV